LDEGVSIDAIIIDFSKPFDLVPYDRLLMKLAASGVDSRVVVWVRKFLVGHAQRVRIEGQLSKEVRVTSGKIRLHRPYYLSRVDHVRKIKHRKQRTDIGKYFFVNRTIKICNRLPAEVLGAFPCKPNTFRKRVRKANITGVK
jgi:hypothetical protein